MERGNLVMLLGWRPCLAQLSSHCSGQCVAAGSTQPVCELQPGPARPAVRDQPVSECGPMLELGHRS